MSVVKMKASNDSKLFRPKLSKTRVTNASLSVAGINAIIDKKERAFIRILFLFAFLTSLCICVFQIRERIIYYTSHPVTLAFEVQRLEKLQFPMVTVCSIRDKTSEKYGNEANNSLEEKWISLGGNVDDIVEHCTYGQRADCSHLWKTQLTAIGRCHTLSLDGVIYLGPGSALQISIHGGEEGNYLRKVLIHEHYEEVVYGVVMNGHDLHSGATTAFFFTHKQFMYHRTPNRECFTKPEVTKCSLSCFDRIFSTISNCRMPHMTTLPDDVNACVMSDADIFTYMSQLRSVVHNASLQCKCGRPCVEDTYEIQVDSRDGSGNFSLFVLPAREELEVMEEIGAYEFYALICDIGGILGLYLGICILTFMEVIEFSLQQFKRNIQTLGKPYFRKK